MPYLGSSATWQDANSAPTATLEETLAPVGAAQLFTNNFRIVGKTRVTIRVEQTAGGLGTIQPQIRQHRTFRALPGPVIAALNTPVEQSYTHAGRDFRVGVTGALAGGTSCVVNISATRGS
jgi:hypothetical protein